MPPCWGAVVAAELLGSSRRGWAPWLAGECLRVRGRGRCGGRAPEILQPPPGSGSGPGGTRQDMVAIAGRRGIHELPPGTPGHNSHRDVGLGTCWAGGGSRVSPVLGSSEINRGSASHSPRTWGPAPGIWGSSAGASRCCRSRPGEPGMRGAAGSRPRSGPTAGASARSPGSARAKRRRAQGAVGLGAADFVVVLSDPKAQHFGPKNERGGQVGSGTMPEGAPRPWDTGGDISARSVAVLPCPGAGARVWACPGREVRGAEPVRVCLYMCVYVCVYVCICVLVFAAEEAM